MLGDAGANLAGAVAGVALFAALGTDARLIALVVVALLTVYGEFRSISAAIERIPPLRALDRIGRTADSQARPARLASSRVGDLREVDTLLEPQQPVVGDRRPGRRVGGELVEGEPDAGVVVEAAHPQPDQLAACSGLRVKTAEPHSPQKYLCQPSSGASRSRSSPRRR